MALRDLHTKRISLIPNPMLIFCWGVSEVEDVEAHFDLPIQYSADCQGFSTMIENTTTKKVYFVLAICQTKITSYELAAVIAHEALHISERYFETLQENMPGEEIRAYTLDAIVKTATEHFLPLLA